MGSAPPDTSNYCIVFIFFVCWSAGASFMYIVSVMDMSISYPNS